VIAAIRMIGCGTGYSPRLVETFSLSVVCLFKLMCVSSNMHTESLAVNSTGKVIGSELEFPLIVAS